MRCAFAKNRECNPSCSAYTIKTLTRKHPRYKEALKTEWNYHIERGQKTYYNNLIHDEVKVEWCRRMNNIISIK